MDRNSMEIVSAAYTVYSLVNPSDRIIISIDSFAEAFKSNLAVLDNNQSNGAGNSEPGTRGQHLTVAKAEETLKRGYSEAESTIDDKEKLTDLLNKLKQKMKSLPMVGSVLANVPTMFKLLNSYLKGEYTEIPRKELVIIVSAISYLVSPIDLVPDFIPVVGLMDDMAIVSICIKATQAELGRYLSWRETNGMTNASGEENT